MGCLLKYLFCFAHFLLFLPCQPCFPERRAPGETLWCAHTGKGGQACFGSFSCIYPREQLSFISWFSLWSARDKLLFHSGGEARAEAVPGDAGGRGGLSPAASAPVCRPPRPSGAPRLALPSPRGSFGCSPRRRGGGRRSLTGLRTGRGWH